jgi:hypothetical protein
MHSLLPFVFYSLLISAIYAQHINNILYIVTTPTCFVRHAVAQLGEATNRKVAGSIPADVI